MASMQIVTRVYPTTGRISSISSRAVSATNGCARPPTTHSTARNIKDLLNGLMLEQYATLTPSAPYYGRPVLYKYDPAKPRRC